MPTRPRAAIIAVLLVGIDSHLALLPNRFPPRQVAVIARYRANGGLHGSSGKACSACVIAALTVAW
jgi:hypothetical protein